MADTTEYLSVEENVDTMIARVNRIRADLYKGNLKPDEREHLRERLDKWRVRLALRLAQQ